MLSLLMASPAFADFMVDPNPGGKQLKRDDVKDSQFTTGDVDGNLVWISVFGPADFASGNGTIKTAGNTTPLHNVIFEPADGDLFDSFSFRGQLEIEGFISLLVFDNQGGAHQEFLFGPFAANANIERIGIKAVPGSGQTIRGVEIISHGFKEQKQTEFGYAGTPVPDTGPTVGMLGLGLVGLAALRRRW